MSHKKHKVKVGRKGRRVASAVAVCAISGVMFSGSANANTTVTAAGVTYRDEQSVDTFSWYDNAGHSSADLIHAVPLHLYPTGYTPAGVTVGQTYTHIFGVTEAGINLSNSDNNHSVPGSLTYTYNEGYADFWFPYPNSLLTPELTPGTMTTTSTVTTYYAPNWYAVLTANGSTVTGTSGEDAIHTDTGVGSTLNLTGTNKFIGTVQLGDTDLFGTREGGAYLYSGTTTFDGSLYANLFMGATSDAGTGSGASTTSTAIFTIAAQTITGNISESTPTSGNNITNVEFQGNNTVTGTVGVDNVYVSGTGVRFNGDVTATALTFSNILGTGGFGGSAYFGSGADMIGNVSYAAGDATLRLSNGSNVTGNITNTATDNGSLIFEGSSAVTGTVGRISHVNVTGSTSLVKLNTTSGTTTVNNLAISADKAVVEVGGLLSATNVTMGGHFSKLELLDRASSAPATEVGTPTTGANTLLSSPATYEAKGMTGTLDFGIVSSTQGKGTLEVGNNVNVTFSTNPVLGITALHANNATLVFAGSSSVGGNLGTSASSSDTFNRIWAGASGETVTFQNDIYVGVNPATAGTAGSLSGSDTHTGSLNVGSGTVNLNGNLYGNLVIGSGGSNAPVSVEGSAYTGYGDSGIGGTWLNGGIVNIAHNKTVSGAITTNADGTGTLNFMGSSNYLLDIGASAKRLSAVTFNSASTGSATTGFTAAISGNVYASTVTIGNAGGELKPVALTDITGAFDYTGTTAMQGWTGGTVANIAPGVTRLGDDLALNNVHDAINFGLAHVTANTFNTNHGALSFTVNSLDLTGVDHAASTQTGSSLLTLTGALTMTGDEKVQVNYVGSLANGGTYTLIKTGAAPGTLRDLGTEGGGNVFDNSFSIDSSVRQATVASSGIDVGDLIVTANRTGGNQNYILKSGRVGSFTNNAGIVLGTIAAAGTQSGDMVEVIQKMDIDNFGYGNNQANLATQVRRLAPIANASYTESAFSSFDLSLNAVDMRMSALRGDCCVSESESATGLSRDSGFWLKGLGSYGKKKQHGEYDGYTTTEYGAAAGLDTHLNEKLLFGLAGSYAATDVKQQDFRYGDTMNIKNYQVTGYLSFDLTKALYVDGAVSYGLNRYDGSRAAAVGRTADANFDGHQFGADFGIGYGIKLGSKTSFTPMASVDYKELKQDAYTETGAGAISLNLDEQAINRTRLGVGGRLATEWSNPGLTVCPEVALFWYHNTNALSKDIVSSFTGGGGSFVTPGVVLDPDTWNLSAALTASSRSAFSLQLRYDLDKRNEFMAHTGTVTARWGF